MSASVGFPCTKVFANTVFSIQNYLSPKENPILEILEEK